MSNGCQAALLVSSCESPGSRNRCVRKSWSRTGWAKHSGRYVHVAQALAPARTAGVALRPPGSRPFGWAAWRCAALRAAARGSRSRLRRGCAQRPAALSPRAQHGRADLVELPPRPLPSIVAARSSPRRGCAWPSLPPAWRRLLAGAAARVLPGLTQGTSSIAAHLSRDGAHLASLADPELTHQPRLGPPLCGPAAGGADSARAGRGVHPARPLAARRRRCGHEPCSDPRILRTRRFTGQTVHSLPRRDARNA